MASTTPRPTPRPAAPDLGLIATTQDGRDITRPYTDRLSVNLPDDTVLLERGGGDYTLYREVLRDDHVMAALQQRRRAVIARPWEVRAGGKRAIDKAAADFLRQNIERIGWDSICEKMLMGVFYGFAVGECLWQSDGRYWTLEAIRVRDRRRFGFDGEDRLRLKTLQQPLGELMPEKKFWVFATGADHDDAPYGLGLGHWLYWPVWFKRNGQRFWAVFLERFGTPALWGKFPQGASAADQHKLLATLSDLRRDAATVTDERMAIELIEATRSGSADHAAFVSQMNAAILVATIGQTASTQGTPGKLGGDEAQNDVRLDIIKADADLLSASFNATVARWLTEWNFPGAAVPGVWRVVEEPADLKTRAECDKSVFEMGYRPTLEHIVNTYGGEWETLPAPAPAPVKPDPIPANPVKPVQFAAAAPAAPAADPVDRLTERLAVAADRQIERLVQTIQAMLEQADDLDAFRLMLEAAWPQLNVDGLADRLAEAMIAADLAGQYEAQREVQAQLQAPMPPPSALPPTINLAAELKLPESFTALFAQAAASAPTVIENHIHVPEAPQPLVQVAAPQVSVTNAVQPAPVNTVVVPTHPVRAIQTVERDPETQEITRTLTTYEKD